jgi:hypothetical protein
VQIVPSDCFLRKLPRGGLRPEHRLSLDAIRAAADMFKLSMDRLAKSTRSISFDIKSAAAQGDLSGLFVDAWAAILNLDSIGKVIKQLKLRSDEILQFLKNADRIRYLRNQFQHFPGNVENRAISKAPRFPQYGVITWTYAPNPEPDPNVFVLFCNLCVHTEQMKMQPVNPAGRVITRPVGCLQLQAYGQIIDYEEMREDCYVLLIFSMKKSQKTAISKFESKRHPTRNH